jgi:hypothetical protein
MTTYQTATKLDRPFSRHLRFGRSAATEYATVIIDHRPEGTVIITVEEHAGGRTGTTTYETVYQGRLFTLHETEPRPERGAKVVAGRWLRELHDAEPATIGIRTPDLATSGALT